VFWGTDEEVSEGGVPRVIVYGYDGFPIQPVPQDEYEREPVYPEYIPLEDEHVFPAEEQPLPPVDSPTAESPGYVAESDPEEDPEYEDDEEQDGPVDYPMGGGDDGGDDDGDSSGDDADDEDKDMEKDERIGERGGEAHSFGRLHLRLQASVSLLTTADATDPPVHPSPSLPQSSVDCRDKIPESEMPPRKRSCLFAIGSRYEAGGSSTTRPTGGQGTDYGFVSTVDMEARRQGIRDVGYGIRDTWIDPAEAVPAVVPTTYEEVNTRVVELAELHEHDIQDLHALLEDAQDGRSRISQRVDKNSQRVDLLMGDRMTLQEIVWTVEEEAYAAGVAWNHSIGLSQETYQELQTHRDHVYAHETHLQTHQTQLQLQSTLIQTQHQVSETRFSDCTDCDGKARETDRDFRTSYRGPSPCQRHEAGDGRHADRVVIPARAVEERETARPMHTPNHRRLLGTRRGKSWSEPEEDRLPPLPKGKRNPNNTNTMNIQKLCKP
ncbi:hypothetical protein Tco_0719690, partial [Tanacetum coccineum]